MSTIGYGTRMWYESFGTTRSGGTSCGTSPQSRPVYFIRNVRGRQTSRGQCSRFGSSATFRPRISTLLVEPFGSAIVTWSRSDLTYSSLRGISSVGDESVAAPEPVEGPDFAKGLWTTNVCEFSSARSASRAGVGRCVCGSATRTRLWMEMLLTTQPMPSTATPQRRMNVMDFFARGLIALATIVPNGRKIATTRVPGNCRALYTASFTRGFDQSSSSS